MRVESIGNGGGAGDLRFDIDNDLLCTADASGHFTSLNAAWERLLGWSREELMARPFLEFVHHEDAERTLEEATKLGRSDYEIASFENRYMTKAGGWRWLHWSARSDGETWFAVAFDVTERKQTEERLRRVLDDEHLLAYSQPILDQRRGRIVQEELLVRMRAAGNGQEIVLPSEFLPDAERCGLIGRVDRWMVGQGVGVASTGRRAEVNLSALSIGDPALTEELAESIDEARAVAQRLVFEITESAAIEHLDAARDFAERLTRLGCRFALDDFGTGFGSLTYLRHLPVRYLKIDVSFVSDLVESPEDQLMVRGIVAIARELGVLTVAEGIEDEATLRMLGDYGVDYAQGYLIGPPAPLV